MKNYFYQILFFCFVVSCNTEAQKKEIIFNPNQSKSYEVSLTTSKLNLDYNVQCDFQKNGEKVLMETTIKGISFTSGSDMDKEINDDYQKYIGNSISNTFDQRGHNESEVNRQRIINTELLVVEFPNKEIKVGDSWQGKKSAKPDMFFETILTKYNCKEIIDDNIVIEAEFIFKAEGKDSSGFDAKMTRNYKGIYTVDNNGVVKSADLKMTGFSGFSNLTGKLQIKEIK